jgi:hypothetical protein
MIPSIKDIFKDSFKNSNGEYSNELTQKEIDLLFEHKLFKCFLSEKVNGLGLTIPQTLSIIEDASYLNGSLGWLIQIGNGGNYFLTNFEEKTGISLFSKNNAVIAGSGTETTTAKLCEDGVILSGKWKFCSGSEYATLFTVTFNMGDSEEIKSGIITREHIKILEDWKTVGMKNTSTNSIEIENVFIPNDHIFNVYEKKSFLDEPVFNLPFIIYAQAFFISVAFGIFKRLIDETEKIIIDSKTFNYRQSERLLKMGKINSKGFKLLENGKKEISELINTLIEQPIIDSNTSKKIQDKFIFHANHLRLHALEMYVIQGIDAVYAENVINIFFNDLLVVTQHKLMNEVVE